MARKPNPVKKDQDFATHLVLPGDLVVKIDAKAKLLAAESPGSTVTRSDVMRRAIYAYVSK